MAGEEHSLASAVVVGKNADARGTEAVKPSVKLLSGLAFVALVAVAVIGLSNSASAAVDGKVYITNVASTLTNEASPPSGRTNASTVYGTYKSDTITGSGARDIVADSNKFIVTVVDSDLNLTTSVTSGVGVVGGVTMTGYAATGGSGGNIFDTVGTGLNVPGEQTQVTLTGSSASPIIGDKSTLSIVLTGTNTVVTNTSVKDILFKGDGTNPAIVILGVDFSTGPGGAIDIRYSSSAVNTITASVKSIVDTTGSVVTLVETGRNTGRFEGFVKVSERTATFTVGVNGGTTGSPATIPAVSGPIAVVYSDAAGASTGGPFSRTTSLTIDTTPPTATISAPASGSESQNRLPTFTGNVTDTQSGLDVSAFSLFIHQAADKTNTTLVINATNTGTPPATVGVAAAIDVSSMKDGVSTLAFSHAQTVILPTGLGTTVPDHVVDYQVQAADLAGNIGYSDSNSAKGNIENSGRHGNQPHTVKIDQVIPQIDSAESGIGLDTSVSPTVDKPNVRDTIKVTFDGKIKDSSVTESDFQVVFSGAGGTFVPASIVVKDAVVYLDLDSTIPSDNKPTVKLQGTIQDLAGNSTDAGSAIAADKLAPVVAITRTKGSGTGTTASEGVGGLTSDKMTITVTSDENLQGTPSITVTDISVTTPSVGNVLSSAPTIALGGNAWDVIVAKGGSASGNRAVKVIAIDSAGNSVTVGDDTTKAYTLDLIVEAPKSTPANAGTTTQSNPFLTTDFTTGGTAEQSTVTVVSATLQVASATALDVTSSVIGSADGKKFFFQPTTALTNAKHTYVLKVADAAGNKSTTTTTFTKTDRKDFELELFAGWNVVSVPSNPLVTDIGSVMTNAGIKQVVAYDATTPSQPWRIASKVGSGAYSSQTTPGLTSVTAGPGYWIETSDFEDQKIALEGPAGPGDARPGLTTIATNSGWNLVGVVDQSRVQTQSGNKGATLTRPDNAGADLAVTVATYFNTVNNGRAYVFNTVSSEFRELANANAVTIGTGIWVYVSPQTSGDLPPIVP